MFSNTNEITALAFAVLVLQLIWWILLFRRPKKRTDGAWVLYATQTGNAQHLAEQTAQQLTTSSQAWTAMNLRDWIAQYDIVALNHTTTLFVVSTQGDGDAPDNGVAFFQKLQQAQTDLRGLSFAILGLGDKSYPQFCGFSQQLANTLTRLSATPLFTTVEVDNLDDEAINYWHQQIARQFAVKTQENRLKSSLTLTATLNHRQHENSGSPTAPLFSLDFTLDDTQGDWQAGDIAEVLIPLGDERLKRTYTIASMPSASNHLSLLVRQLQKDNGELGIGSGYLTQTLNTGETVELCIKNNPHFHLPTRPTPIIFIATGSGLAGILSLLQSIDTYWQGGEKHHLIYGERYPEFDTPCRTQLDKYTQSGLLQADYCFSRGESEFDYVQNALRARGDVVKCAIHHGAMVYVCGSKEALGKSIPATLAEILGDADFQAFIARDGLRTDVY